jgi:hypothetical protein
MGTAPAPKLHKSSISAATRDGRDSYGLGSQKKKKKERKKEK